MQHFFQRFLLRVAILVALVQMAPAVLAAGLVQVTLRGNIYESGGARVEFLTEAGGKKASFRGLLARGTHPADLARLLERRMKKSGVDYIMGSSPKATGPFSFFIEDCELISLRVSGGLEARITAVEEAPVAFRLLPPRSLQASQGGNLRIYLATESKTDQKEAVVELELDLLDKRGSATWVAERLGKLATSRGVTSRRPSPDAWAPGGMTRGDKIVGLSVELETDAGWAIEMRLAPRVQSR